MEISNIQNRLKVIEDYKNENKKAKELLKGSLENNEKFVEISEAVKDATTLKKKMKDEIYALPENEKLVWQIKENQEEIKINEEILSTELLSYYQKSKSNEIKDHKGVPRRFQLSVKFVASGKEE